MSSQSFSFGASPSVTKERWLKHAVHKMNKGYNLIINNERKVANFYKGYGDFESCSYKTARKLVLQEFVELVGEHEMGLEYSLKGGKSIEVDASPDDDDDVGIDADSAIEESEAVLDDDLEEAGGDDEDEEEPKYHDDEDE